MLEGFRCKVVGLDEDDRFGFVVRVNNKRTWVLVEGRLYELGKSRGMCGGVRILWNNYWVNLRTAKRRQWSRLSLFQKEGK